MYHLYNLLLFSRFFEDQELHKDKDSKYRFKKDGKKHTLIIMEATLDDIGMYHAWTNGGHTKGELEVEGTTPTCHWRIIFSYHLLSNGAFAPNATIRNQCM